NTIFVSSTLPQPPDLPSFPTRRSSDLASPGRTNIVLRSWRLNRANATATPSRSATNTPRLRPEIGPAQGPYSKKRWWMIPVPRRSEEHTSELQSRFDLVCRLLLEKKKY